MNQELVRNLFDYRDDELWWKERPSYRVDMSKPAGSVDHYGYRVIKIKGKIYKTHRLIWLYVHGKFPDNHIDHVNGIKDDNRIENLRDVSRQENLRNAAKYKNNTSGHLGVSWNTRSDKWNAQIKVDGKNKHLGFFNILEDAVEARKLASIEHDFHENHGRLA